MITERDLELQKRGYTHPVKYIRAMNEIADAFKEIRARVEEIRSSPAGRYMHFSVPTLRKYLVPGDIK